MPTIYPKFRKKINTTHKISVTNLPPHTELKSAKETSYTEMHRRMLKQPMPCFESEQKNTARQNVYLEDNLVV